MFDLGSSVYVGTMPCKVVGISRRGPEPDANGVIHLPETPDTSAPIVAYVVRSKRGTQRVDASQVSRFTAASFTVSRR